MRGGAAIKTTPPPSLKALFNASCTRLSLVRFPPQDILTPFHRATGTQTEDRQIFGQDFLLIALRPGSTG